MLYCRTVFSLVVHLILCIDMLCDINGSFLKIIFIFLFRIIFNGFSRYIHANIIRYNIIYHCVQYRYSCHSAIFLFIRDHFNNIIFYCNVSLTPANNFTPYSNEFEILYGTRSCLRKYERTVRKR